MNLASNAIQKALENNWQEAIKLNLQILELYPDDINALNRLGQAYLRTQSYTKAKKIYSKVLKLDKYNPIAQKNFDRIKSLKDCSKKNVLIVENHKHIDFIEESGKSKVIPLTRICEKNTLNLLEPCLKLDFKIRKQNISFYYKEKYIGRLPDDISKRLIWLSKRNNKYCAFIKSINPQKITVFVKETKQSAKNKNFYSFTKSDKN